MSARSTFSPGQTSCQNRGSARLVLVGERRYPGRCGPDSLLHYAFRAGDKRFVIAEQDELIEVAYLSHGQATYRALQRKFTHLPGHTGSWLARRAGNCYRPGVAFHRLGSNRHSPANRRFSRDLPNEHRTERPSAVAASDADDRNDSPAFRRRNPMVLESERCISGHATAIGHACRLRSLQRARRRFQSSLRCPPLQRGPR